MCCIRGPAEDVQKSEILIHQTDLTLMKQSASVPELRPGGGRGVSQSEKTPPGGAGGQRRGQLCGGVRVCGGEPGPVLGPERRVHVGGAGQE